jgi:ketosteroid isomerase-like protein
MNEKEAIEQAALRMADAIGRRDVAAVESLLAPGFVHQSPGGPSRDAESFLAAIQQIPGVISFVRLERLQVEIAGSSALVTGIQHAAVDVDGQEIEDRRAFVDWFVKHDGSWRFRVAVDLPAPEEGEADGG